jgi:exodeoxyribonuclease VII small subunit
MKVEALLEDFLAEKDPKTFVESLTFEQGIALLEELVGSVESGSLPLDQAVLSYERGVVLVESLRKLLTGAEEKLRLFQKTDA